MSEVVDQVARDKARDAAHDLANHIAVTAIKLDNLDKRIETGQNTLNAKIDATHEDTNTKIDRIESILKWVGGLIVMLFLSTLTWSLTQQYNANEQTKKDLSAQVELLKTQEANSVVARSERQQILSRLPSGTTEAAVPTNSGR